MYHRQRGGAVRWWCGVTLLLLLAGCATPAPSEQDNLPTPTPLPPAPALERPTYEVERGTIERTIDPNGRVTPVDMVQLAFRRSGRVEVVHVRRGDAVQEGDVLAQLIQDDEVADLRDAEDAVVQAQRDLETARSQKEKDIRRAENALQQAQRALEKAREDRDDQIRDAETALEESHRELGRLLPGGQDDVLRDAREALEDAQREAHDTKQELSKAKTDAEHALIDATNALKDAQEAYSDAYWDKQWVDEHGTHPEATIQQDAFTGETEEVHRDITEEEKREFARALEDARVALDKAEREVEQAERAVTIARENEVSQGQVADREVKDAERAYNALLHGENQEIIQAQNAVEENQEALDEAQQIDLYSEQNAVEDAQLELEEARAETFNTELKQVETAQRELEKARKTVQNGQIIAPQAGEVLAITIAEGDQVEEFDPVMEIADPANLEISAELSAEQMRQLAEGQPADISLLSRPDVTMPAVIRRMPAPYGAGGSGVVQEDDKSTRFEILDAKGQTLAPGAVVKIRIVLERKEDVLMLQPEAIRSFEGRTFVIVREGERERRVPVETGIETPDAVEVIEGVEAGAIVVGQ